MTTSGQEMLDALPDGIAVADAEGVVVGLNPLAARMLGTSVPAAVGRPLAEVLCVQDQAGRDWCSVNRPYDGLCTRSGIPEQSWFLPSGAEVLVATRIQRRGADHTIDRVAVSLRSGRGRARLDRERSDLVATVAHELRSPLTGVKGFVQALINRWDKLSEAQRLLMLTTVNADADRLSRLIAELLDVARIDTGRLSLYPRPVDAALLSGRVVTSVAAGTARPVELQAAAELPELWADPDKLTQVVTNLVENAVRHGAGPVRIVLAPLPPGGELEGISISVEDEGEGIAPEIRRRVFTKFWTHGASGGSGLGMYIVNGLVRAHGGTVEIGDSAQGGARVTVHWPVAAAG